MTDFWDENAAKVEACNILKQFRANAEKGMSVLPLSKYNSFRARWLKEKMNDRHQSNDHFRHEYNAMPDFIKADIEGNVIGR